MPVLMDVVLFKIEVVMLLNQELKFQAGSYFISTTLIPGLPMAYENELSISS